jgi:hypothetical protein
MQKVHLTAQAAKRFKACFSKCKQLAAEDLKVLHV